MSMSIDPDLEAQIDRLKTLNAAELRHHYAEVFGSPTVNTNLYHLRRQIAWRLQMEAFGGLAERSRERAREIAAEAELKDDLPFGSEERRQRKQRIDPRLPPPGTELVRVYQGKTVVVKVLATGFEYEGQRYASLSAVARAITGTPWNGLVFFGLAKRGETPPPKRSKRNRATKVSRAA